MAAVDVPLGIAAGYSGLLLAGAFGLARLAARTERSGPLGVRRDGDLPPIWPHVDAAHFERIIAIVAAVAAGCLAAAATAVDATRTGIAVLVPLAILAAGYAVALARQVRQARTAAVDTDPSG